MFVKVLMCADVLVKGALNNYNYAKTKLANSFDTVPVYIKYVGFFHTLVLSFALTHDDQKQCM